MHFKSDEGRMNGNNFHYMRFEKGGRVVGLFTGSEWTVYEGRYTMDEKNVISAEFLGLGKWPHLAIHEGGEGLRDASFYLVNLDPSEDESIGDIDDEMRWPFEVKSHGERLKRGMTHRACLCCLYKAIPYNTLTDYCEVCVH